MIGKEIIEKIKKEEIKMKPKSYFIFKAILLIALAIVFFFISLYLSSFILFAFRPFPWILLLFLVVSIALVEYILKEFKVVYKRPIIYSLIIVISILFILGMFLNRIRFHERMEKRNLPGIRKFYDQKGIKKPNIEIKARKRL